MPPIVKRFPLNPKGRDFVIGDVHGTLSLVDRAMEALHFAPAQDRLFSVGDLIDRGPDSARVIEFLSRPYVHAVRGNHEDMLLTEQSTQDAIKRPSTWGNGSEWWKTVPPETRQKIRTILKKIADCDRDRDGERHGRGYPWRRTRRDGLANFLH